MKKFLTIAIILVFLIGLMTTVSAAEQENVSVYINGEEIEFEVDAQVINGRTMVPMRKIFEKL